MALISKKSGEEEQLPELPELPELPKVKGQVNPNNLPPLPSFPDNDIGEKFSQNAIKEAVSGKNEDELETEEQIMPKPLTKIPLSKEIPKEFEEAARKVKSAEPVFIRIDKFEDCLEIFEQTKEKISEIEKTLGDIKRIKAEEEKELEAWGNEIQLVKSQIEKIDKEIFSKIE